MHDNNRPKRVLIIGIAWFMFGGWMCWRAVETVASRPSILPIWSADFLFEILLLISVFGTGVVGAISAIYFIMRRSWARTALELVNWICLLFVLGIFVLFAFEAKDQDFSEVWKLAAVLTCISGVFITLLGYLRGEVVRGAMEKRERACPAFLKKAKKFGVISLLILVGVAVATTLFLFLGGRSPEPDVSDLQVERMDLPPEENAFTYFEKAREVFDVPDEHGYGRIFEDYLDGEAVEEDRVREVIVNNAETIEFIRQGLQRKRCIVPEITSPETELPYISQWRGFARMLVVKSRLHLIDGDYAEAAEACSVLLEFGNMITKDTEALINYNVGLDVIRLGSDTAQLLAQDPNMPLEGLEKIAEPLGKFAPLEQGFIRGFKLQYKVFDNFIDEFPESAEFIKNIWPEPDIPPYFIPVYGRIPYLFDRNEARRKFADICRRAVLNASLCYAESEIDQMSELVPSTREFAFRPRRNVVGEFLVAFMYPFSGRIIARKIRTECKLAATRLIVAINQHKRVEGEFPERLNELVPQYLDSVPQDPFDCKPMRYNSELGVVYSVGKNLEDNGGEAILKADEYGERWSRERWDAEDIVFEISPVEEKN